MTAHVQGRGGNKHTLIFSKVLSYHKSNQANSSWLKKKTSSKLTVGKLILSVRGTTDASEV